MKKRVLSLLLMFLLVLGMLPMAASAEAVDVPVANNVINITDNKYWSYKDDRMYTTATQITVAGATVESATEDGTTVNAMLASDTDPNAELTVTFGISKAFGCDASQSVNKVTLTEGKAKMEVTLTGSWGSKKGTATYTIHFDAGLTLTDPPVVSGETARTAEVYTTLDLNLPVSEYFGTASKYYLVNGEEKTEIGRTYTASWEEAGTYDLVFKAGNSVGLSDPVTVTVTVTEIPRNDISVVVPEGYDLSFHAVTGLENGSPVLGAELICEDGVLKVPQNISRIAWSCEGAVGMSAPIEVGSPLTLREVTFSAKTAIGDVDTGASVTVTDSAGHKVSGTVADTFLLADGSGYTYTVTPSVTGWNAVTLSSQTVSAETAEVEAKFSLKNAQTITAPADADVTVYYQSMYYKASVVEPVYYVENDNDTITYYYSCSKSSDNSMGYAYRATLGDNIVKAGYMYDKPAVTLEWNDSKSPDYDDTTYETPNYGLNAQTRSSIGDGVYMNVNSSGHLVLSDGDTKELGAFRVWEIINHDAGNLIIQPDFHFTRVAGEDIYSLSPIPAASAYGNNWQKLTATGRGTAFLEVTYDAIHIVTGAEKKASSASYGHLSDYVYNASDPTQAGLLIIQTDGNEATDVSFGIEGKSWDAELDTYYFYGDTGSLNLTPSAGSSIVSVEVSNDKGSTWKTLSADDNGNYVAEVHAGNNIIRVTNGNGQTAYQVVRAIQLEVMIQNLTDTTAGSSYKPGDKVRVIFDGLIRPTYKLSGIYNPQQNSVQFKGTDNATYKTNNVNSYYFGVPFSYSGNDYYYTSFDVTLPSTQTNVDEAGNFVLSDGHFYMKGYIGNGNEHRSKLSYDGVPINGSAPETTKNRAVFEDIVLPLFEVEENHLPELTDEDQITRDMRLGQWEDINLADYFTDADGDDLTYYILEADAEAWAPLTGSSYTYFPAGDGVQNVAFMALDGSMTLEEAEEDENTALLMLTANVAEAPSEVTVTFSVTQGTKKFYTSDQSAIMTKREMTVPYFDLALYGMENYYYNPRCYASYIPGTIGSGTAGTEDSADGIVTTLHAFIWATEVYQLGLEPEDLGTGVSYEENLIQDYFSVGQSAGSVFANLWNGTNANYYLNMQYPMGCAKTGSTCDQQALYDGDVISLHMIEDKDVMGASFSALVADEDDTYNYASDSVEKTVAKGESVTLTAYHSQSDWTNYITSYVAYPNAPVVYTTEFTADISKWQSFGKTNDNGQITINTSEMNGDTYYFAVQGVVDSDANKETGISMFTLTVEGSESDTVVEVDTSKLGELLPKENITIADGTMTIAPADNTPACMVLVKNGDQYTRVAATKNADNTYNFNVSNLPEGASIVVAAKADLDGNGTIDAPETVQIKAAQLGNLTTFSNLQNMVADLDGNGEIDAAETVQIKAAQLGNFVLGW